MASASPTPIFSALRVVLGLAGMLAVAGCANAPGAKLFALGGVDPNSSVAADVEAATQAPGPYPNLHAIPPNPTDVRPASAWKSAVVSEWSEKRQLEADAAAIPFALSNSEPFANAARARIAPDLATQAPIDAAAQTKAFADSERARATPPPKPN